MEEEVKLTGEQVQDRVQSYINLKRLGLSLEEIAWLLDDEASALELDVTLEFPVADPLTDTGRAELVGKDMVDHESSGS